MNLDWEKYKPFLVSRVFKILNGKGITKEELEENPGDFIVVQSGEENNGVLGKISLSYCKKMNYTFTNRRCLTVARSGSAGFVSFQPNGCVVGDSAKILLLDEGLNDEDNIYLYLHTILTANRFKYTYGRKVTEVKYGNEIMLLPVSLENGKPVMDSSNKYSDEGYIPDWEFMSRYIKNLHHKPLTTKNKSINTKKLLVNEWEEFLIGDIFDVKYGINMELDSCDEVDMNDKDAIAFVARTSDNNGVSAFVKYVEGKNPQKAMTITCAGGGSVLSTFVQAHDFYSGRDLYLLYEKEKLSIHTKLFLTTVIEQNKYRFSYGRQANKTLSHLVLKLPIKRDDSGNPILDSSNKYSEKGYIPDWTYMEEYVKALPYGDRLNN